MYQDRQMFMDNLKDFINSYKTRLNNVLEEIGWSKESIHAAYEKQVQTEEKSFSDAAMSCPEAGASSSSFASECPRDCRVSNRNGEIPHRPGLSKETARQELLYTELVESLSIPTNLKNENKSKEEVLAEMLKMERDAKRRRMNYKNRVHTKNKSHIEILREVLAEQMSTLSDSSAVMETASCGAKVGHTKSEKTELVEVQVVEGNPHLFWKKLLKHNSLSSKKRRFEEFAHGKEDCDKKKNYKDKHSNYKKDTQPPSKYYKNEISQHKGDNKRSYDDRSYDGHKYHSYRDDHTRLFEGNHKNSTPDSYNKYRTSKHNAREDSPKRYYDICSDKYRETSKQRTNCSGNDSFDDERRKDDEDKKKKHKRDSSNSSRRKSKKHKRDTSKSPSPTSRKSKKRIR